MFRNKPRTLADCSKEVGRESDLTYNSSFIVTSAFRLSAVKVVNNLLIALK